MTQTTKVDEIEPAQVELLNHLVRKYAESRRVGARLRAVRSMAKFAGCTLTAANKFVAERW
jgi:hypothetical protein